jgi:hypothetical protein
MIKTQGYTGVTEIPQTVNYTPKTGWKTNKVYEGPYTSLQQMAAAFVAAYGVVVTVNLEHVLPNRGKLTVTFDRLEGDEPPEQNNDGTPQEEQASWSLTGQNMELSLWTHPIVKDLANNCTTQYSFLRKNLKIIESKGTFTEVLAAMPYNTDCEKNAVEVLKLFRDGVSSYQHSAYVLRRNAVLRNDAQGQIATGNVNKIYTTASLKTLEGLPNALSFAVPNLQWLKSAPTISYQGSKLTADNEWVGADSWSTLLYAYAS